MKTSSIIRDSPARVSGVRGLVSRERVSERELTVQLRLVPFHCGYKNLDFDHLRKKVHLGAFQRQLRPRRVDGNTQQVARCAPVHSAGSQLPLRVLGMYICRAPETTRRR